MPAEIQLSISVQVLCMELLIKKNNEMKKILLFLICLLLVINAALSQNVGIGTSTPQSQLHIGANSTNELIIGRNKATGGFTALYLGTSSLSNGYSYLQSVQSSGSLYGNLLLNPNNGSVGIGTFTPKPSAVLDISSSNKGVLFPHMNIAARNSIANPAQGLHVFNTDIGSLEYYDTTFKVWTAYCSNCGVFTDTITVNTTAYLVPPGYNKVRIVINSGIIVSGTSVAPAISLVNVSNGGSVIIENYGGIYGKGGDGGAGGGNSTGIANNCLPVPPQAGNNGTDAVHSKSNSRLLIYNYGIIAGGGGGGGGGNYGTSLTSAGGGGGGGQAVPSSGGIKGNYNVYTSLPLPLPSYCGPDQSNPANATDGGPGAISTPGNFGLGSTGTGGGSRGGLGGTLGLPGQAGFGTGGAGGAAGKAVRFNTGNNTITNIGTGVVFGVVD